MTAPADDGQARAELDRALVDLWGVLEEARLKQVDLLARGPLFEGRDHLRARLREYGRTLAYLQRSIGELRRTFVDQGAKGQPKDRAASEAAG